MGAFIAALPARPGPDTAARAGELIRPTTRRASGDSVSPALRAAAERLHDAFAAQDILAAHARTA